MRDRKMPLRRRGSLLVKRAFDLVSCGGIALTVLPFFPLMAVLVKITSRGPVFFIQKRVGYKQHLFSMYKFRTMSQPEASHDPTRWTKGEEARITSMGRIYRDYGLDELPQLFCIIKGDMSVIGPRPPLPPQVEEYSDQQKQMFEMRPGVLSLAAIKGRRSLSVEKRIAYHVEYVKDWSLLLDLEILIKSTLVVLGRQDATEDLS